MRFEEFDPSQWETILLARTGPSEWNMKMMPRGERGDVKVSSEYGEIYDLTASRPFFSEIVCPHGHRVANLHPWESVELAKRIKARQVPEAERRRRMWVVFLMAMILLMLLLVPVVLIIPFETVVAFPAAILIWLAVYLSTRYWLRAREQQSLAARQQAIALEEFPDIHEAREDREREERERLGRREYLESISPREFEHAVAEILQQAGYESPKMGTGVADFGADILVRKGGLTYAVQVKQWANPVHRPEIQKLQGAMAYFRADAGIFVTLGRLSSAAIEYAHQQGIITIDGDRLVNLARGEKESPTS